MSSLTGFNAASGHGTSSLDGKDVLHGHEEGLVDLSGRCQDFALHSLHQLHDSGTSKCIITASTSSQSGTTHNADVIPIELVLAEQFTDYTRETKTK
jgi:hypothetical protein